MLSQYLGVLSFTNLGLVNGIGDEGQPELGGRGGGGKQMDLGISCETGKYDDFSEKIHT